MTARIAALLAAERHRGAYRMALLECVDAFNDDVAWLRNHVARLKVVSAAQLEAGSTLAIDADDTRAEFERRWRVRVDVHLGAVGVSPLGDDLYIYDDTGAIAAKPLSADATLHLARHSAEPHRVFVLDRLAPRRVAEALLPALIRRGDQERLPTFRPGTLEELEKDRAIVRACANEPKSNIPSVVATLNPTLAADLRYIAPARRPPTRMPACLTRAQREAWKLNLDKWTKLRKETAHRWEALRPWIEPAPGSLPLSDYRALHGRVDDDCSGASVLDYKGGAIPELVPPRGERRMMPGESQDAPFQPSVSNQRRRNVRTNTGR